MEILMAFTILVSGIVGVYALFSVGVVSHKRAVDNSIASTLAGSVFDDIAANYETYYYDNDNNGFPDLGEDRNQNNQPDWFERGVGGLKYPIPYRRGYEYDIEYEYNAMEAPQELFVTVKVVWLASGRNQSETFRRAIYIRRLPAIKGQ
jgi:hypothetical protein